MQVILTKNNTLGNVGDTVNVKNGFARNYLIPNGYAVTNTLGNREYFNSIRAELEKQAQDEINEAKKLAKIVENTTLQYAAKVIEGDTIYGSVSIHDIISLLEDAHSNLSVNKNQISFANNINSIGEYDVIVKFHRDVQSNIKLVVSDAKSE